MAATKDIGLAETKAAQMDAYSAVRWDERRAVQRVCETAANSVERMAARLDGQKAGE